MSELRDLMDPVTIGLMRRACVARRARLAQAVLAEEPTTAEQALVTVLRARALDGVLAQIEADPVAFFEED